MKLTLPTDSQARKEVPVVSGVLKYFPAAIAGVARVSYLGNKKHNGDAPLHHVRGKSSDHSDCVVRHLMDVNDLLAQVERNEPIAHTTTELSEQILLEVSQLAWRALALSQELHEQFSAGRIPMAPGAK